MSSCHGGRGAGDVPPRCEPSLRVRVALELALGRRARPRRRVLQPIVDSWSTAPTTPGEAIAVAVESLDEAERLADHPVIEVVCTGPNSPLAPMCVTSQVVLDLVGGAAERLMIRSFSSYGVAPVVKALDTAVARRASGWILCWSRRATGAGRGRRRLRGRPSLRLARREASPERTLARQGRRSRQPRCPAGERQPLRCGFQPEPRTGLPNPWRRLSRIHPTTLRRPDRNRRSQAPVSLAPALRRSG